MLECTQMPRYSGQPSPSDSKNLSTQFYHSHFSNTSVHYIQDSSSIPSSNLSQPQKKKHVCPTCDRPFTTSGHLARHSRVHTGERNHKCPFPGCETRCSRQDNLQQQSVFSLFVSPYLTSLPSFSYRIHLSPGSRRSSTRSAIARAMNNTVLPLSGNNRRPSTSSGSPDSPPSIPPLLSAPPSLEPARVYTLSSPPDSPPQLAQATLPATAHPPPESVSSSSSSTPESPYSPINRDPQHTHMVPMSSQPIPITAQPHHSHTYSPFRSGPTPYQEHSQGPGFTYIHPTPLSTNGVHHSHNSYSYSASQYDDDHHSVHQQHLQDSHNNHGPSSPTTHVSSISSRHSISHISHPNSHTQSYSHPHSSDPPSPSSSPHTGPTTPSSYSIFHDDTHYQQNGLIIDHTTSADQQQHSISSGHHLNSQGQLVHPAYSPTLPLLSLPPSSSSVTSHSLPERFSSPPPTLAPIQDERVMRGDSSLRSSVAFQGTHPQQHRHHHSHSATSYLHHSQPLATDYPYHSTIGIGHGHAHGHTVWKMDGGLRSKGLGALVQ